MSKLKLKFLLMVCDFMLDWYHFRKVEPAFKEKRKQRIMGIRQEIVDELEAE